MSLEVISIDSILTSIKKLLGITEEDECFDQDLIIHINSVLAILTQIGIGSSDGFMVIDKSNVWNEFVPERVPLNFIKTYTFLKVRLLFDPPQNSSVMNAINNQLQELEWRISVTIENSNKEDEIQND